MVWHTADILKSEELGALFKECRPTHLIHSAWNIRENFYDATENLRWAECSVELLRRAEDAGVQRVLGIGTCAEYGLDHEICDEQLTTLNPVGRYAEAKHATQLSFTSGLASTCSVAWARLFFPYGPHEDPRKLTSYAISQLLKDEYATFTNGEQTRDLLFISDVGDALVAILFSQAEGPINVASGVGIRIADVIRSIGDIMGKPEFIQMGVRQRNHAEAKCWVASIRRLKHEVGWQPRVSLQEGLSATIASIRERNVSRLKDA